MPAQKREAIAYLVREHGLSICTACRCLLLSRSAWYRPLVDWRARDGAVGAGRGQTRPWLLEAV
jgi:putative transposase